MRGAAAGFLPGRSGAVLFWGGRVCCTALPPERLSIFRTPAHAAGRRAGCHSVSRSSSEGGSGGARGLGRSLWAASPLRLGASSLHTPSWSWYGWPAGQGGCSAAMALSWVWQAPGAGSSRWPPPAPRFPVGAHWWVGPPGPPGPCQGPFIAQRPEARWCLLFKTESRTAVCPSTPLSTQGTRVFRDRTAC